MQVLGFSISDDQHIAIEIGYVDGIIKLPEVTKVPGTTSHVVGMISMRGKLMSVVDLNILFHETRTIDPNLLILVSVTNHDSLALLAQSVTTVYTLSDDMMFPTNTTVVKGMYRSHKDTLMSILDVEKMMKLILDK